MKIYHLEHFIELAGLPPERIPENTLVAGCANAADIRVAVDHFFRPGFSGNLLLYPIAEGTDLCGMLHQVFKPSEAAGGIVINERCELLLIRRWNHWDLPKGKLHLKQKESPENGAIREVMEETGLSAVRILNGLPDTFHLFQRDHQWYLKRTSWFLMEAASSQRLVPQREEDIVEARWVPAAAVETYIPETWASLHELVRLAAHAAADQCSG